MLVHHESHQDQSHVRTHEAAKLAIPESTCCMQRLSALVGAQKERGMHPQNAAGHVGQSVGRKSREASRELHLRLCRGRRLLPSQMR